MYVLGTAYGEAPAGKTAFWDTEGWQEAAIKLLGWLGRGWRGKERGPRHAGCGHRTPCCVAEGLLGLGLEVGGGGSCGQQLGSAPAHLGIGREGGKG